MLSFSKKNILLGVTGGIAAYKSAEIIRLFKKLGADVRVVMTESAKEFITPLTLQAISGNEIHDSLLNNEDESKNHQPTLVYFDKNNNIKDIKNKIPLQKLKSI